MSMREYVVIAAIEKGRTKTAIADQIGVSRRTVHEILRRYCAGGLENIEPRSRAPKTVANRTGLDLEDEIVRIRKQLVDEGFDSGPASIYYWLTKTGWTPPSISTIWRILKRRGFIKPQPQKRPKSSYIRFEAKLPNAMWQADMTHWHLKDGTKVEIVNIIDDHSRFLLGIDVFEIANGRNVKDLFAKTFENHGIPTSTLTDNGCIFTARFRNGICALEELLNDLGVQAKHSKPYHPQTCGKVERFHQTLKKWLEKHPARTIEELKLLIAEFVKLYNTKRPHRALGSKTPAEAYYASPKAIPANRAFPRFRIRKDNLGNNGFITLRHNGQLYKIGISRRYKHQPVYALQHNKDIRIVTISGTPVRHLTLNPDKKYQRLT